MDKKPENTPAYVKRHLSQIKILARLLEHELDTAKGDDITLERALVENVLDTLEIYIDDTDGAVGGSRGAGAGGNAEAKPTVTRLN